MARLYLVRHGQAAAGYGADRDPGLSDLGRTHADDLIAAMSGVGPIPIVSSPLRRCQETAAPLAKAWGVEVSIDPVVAEVASPTDDLTERAEWLRRAMATTWSELEPAPVAWRQRLLEHLHSFEQDSVLVTHFVVINAVIGAARADDRVMVASVGYTSVTVVDAANGELKLVSEGEQAASEVL